MKNAGVACAVIATLFGAGSASAGGLWLNEFGDFSGGRASAGSGAGLDEAAAIIHNPASATRLEGRQLFLSAGVFLPETKFDIDYTGPLYGDDDGGDAALNAPGASFAYVHDTHSDRWSAGVYMAGLSGAGLEYNSQWIGRFQATDVELLLLAIAPTAAYQVTDKLSVGAALQIYYSTLELKLRVPNAENPGQGQASIDGSDEGLGFALGLLYELSDQTRLGLNYQSKLDIEYDGKLKVNVVDVRVDSDTELTMAQLVRVSLHHDLNDRFSLGFTLGWDDWSALDNVFISVPDREAGLEKNWDDTYHYAAGFQYQLNKDWAITSGIAYDTNPVDARDRTADMPIDRQVRYSVGARYQFRENMTLGGFLNYADLGSAKIRTESWGGEYEKNKLIQIALNLNWKF